MSNKLDTTSRVPGRAFLWWVIYAVVGAALFFYTAQRLGSPRSVDATLGAALDGETLPSPREVSADTELRKEAHMPEDNGRKDQNAQIDDSPGATVYQAGRDINLVDPRALTSLQSIQLEARRPCTLQPGAEIPPSEVEFMPVGDAHAYLVGAAGRERLAFVSPVRFRPVGDDRVTVLNHFALSPGSALAGRPVDALTAYASLVVPIVTVVHGAGLAKMVLLEVTLTVNGEILWYGAWPYDVDFESGQRFEVPLTDLHTRIRSQ